MGLKLEFQPGISRDSQGITTTFPVRLRQPSEFARQHSVSSGVIIGPRIETISSRAVSPARRRFDPARFRRRAPGPPPAVSISVGQVENSGLSGPAIIRPVSAFLPESRPKQPVDGAIVCNYLSDARPHKVRKKTILSFLPVLQHLPSHRTNGAWKSDCIGYAGCSGHASNTGAPLKSGTILTTVTLRPILPSGFRAATGSCFHRSPGLAVGTSEEPQVSESSNPALEKATCRPFQGCRRRDR